MAKLMRGRTDGPSDNDKRLRIPHSGGILPGIFYILPMEIHHHRDHTQTEFNFKDIDRSHRQNTYVGQRPYKVEN